MSETTSCPVPVAKEGFFARAGRMAPLGVCFGGTYGLALLALRVPLFLSLQSITWYRTVAFCVEGPLAGALGGLVSLGLIGVLGGRPPQVRGMLRGAVSGAIGSVFGAVAFVTCCLVVAHRDLSQIDEPYVALFFVGIVAGIGGGAAWGIDALAHQFGWKLIYPASLGIAVVGLLAVVERALAQRLEPAGWGDLLSACVVPGTIAGLACWSRYGAALRHHPLAVCSTSVGGLALGMVVLLHWQPARPYEGKSVGYWQQELRTTDPNRHFEAAEMLRAMLRDDDPDTRFWAVHALAEDQQVNEEVIEALVAFLDDPDSKKRLVVTRDLVHDCPMGDPAVTQGILRALQDEDEEVRLEAAWAKFSRAAEVENLIPALSQALKDRALNIRLEVARKLGQMGPRARAALPALQAALKDPSGAVRQQAAESIGNIGPEAKDALPDLIKALGDERANIRVAAARALGKIHRPTKAIIAVLAMALKHKDDWIRQEAAESLGEMGPEAREAIPDLLAALHDSKDNVSQAAADALRKIEPEAAKVGVH